MNASLRLLLALALLLPFFAPAARAEEAGFRLEDLEVLPVHDLEWGILLLERPELIVRMHLLGERAKKVAAHLADRENANDDGSRKLRLELARLADQMAPSVQALREALRPLGVSDDVWSVVRDAPRGRLRVERHAMRLPLALPGVAPKTSALHARLVPVVEGALLALDRHREELDDDAQAARAAVESQMQGIRVRFWRVMDATLDRERRTLLRRRLPNPIAKPVDLLGHVFLLPGLTTSQGARLKALLVQIEAESGPDTAAIKRLKARLGEADLPGSERSRLEREKRGAERRSVTRAVKVWRDGLAILGADQVAELHALPPFLSAQARVGDLEQDLAGIEWQPGQEAALKAFGARHAGLKGRMLQRLGVAELKARAAGPDGPERDAVEMMRYGAYAEALGAARVAVHELFTDLLTEDQVIRWVVEGE